MRHGKKQKNVTNPQEIQWVIETAFEVIRVIDLADKDIKAANINMFKELKETTLK